MQTRTNIPTTPEKPLSQQAFELADGTRLVPLGEATPARIDGDRDHAFTLADVIREGGEPFAGYTRL
jgi:hypothetical protein